MSLKVPPVVSAVWLQEQLSKSSAGALRLLDTSWSHIQGGRQDYCSKHIPGALFLDLNKCIRATPTRPRNLPEPGCFQKYARHLGINQQSHLVLYDRKRIHASTRAWWTFRAFGHEYVSVLDGGLMQWIAKGFETTSEEEPASQIKNGDFEVRIKRYLIAEYEDVVDQIQNNSAQVVDARRREHYLGLEQEPSKYTKQGCAGMGQQIPEKMHRGHMPGAIHFHKDQVLDQETMCFLPKEKLQQLFSERGINFTKPMTTLCYGGHSASLINMAAYLCGQETSAMYYGSWTEWGQIAEPDLVVGPEDNEDI